MAEAPHVASNRIAAEAATTMMKQSFVAKLSIGELYQIPLTRIHAVKRFRRGRVGLRRVRLPPLTSWHQRDLVLAVTCETTLAIIVAAAAEQSLCQDKPQFAQEMIETITERAYNRAQAMLRGVPFRE